MIRQYDPDPDPIPLQPMIGSWVGYVLKEGKNPGEIRYGFVVAVHSKENVNVVIFTNGVDDFEKSKPGCGGMIWVENTLYSEDPTIKGTWHWPME